MHLAIQTDLLTTSNLATSLAKLHKQGDSDGNETEKTPMARSNIELNRLKASSKELLHMAILMYAEGKKNKVRQEVIRLVCAPTVALHSAQNTQLRSTDWTVHWEPATYNGDLRDHSIATVACLRDEGGLLSAGFIVDRGFGDAGLTLDDPHIVREQEIADLLGRMTLAMVSVRLRRLLPIIRGWPRQQTKFLDPKLAGAAFHEWRSDWLSYLELQSGVLPLRLSVPNARNASLGCSRRGHHFGLSRTMPTNWPPEYALR